LADEQAAAAQQNVKKKPAAVKVKREAADLGSEQVLPIRSKKRTKSQQAGPPTKYQAKAAPKQSETKVKAEPSSPDPESQPPLNSDEEEGARCFLDLPPNVRKQIYEYALISLKQPIWISRTSPHLSEPALFFVSQMIRDEAIATFYGKNIFAINGSVMIVKFLRTVDEEKLQAVRTIHIYCNQLRDRNNAITRADQLLQEFKGRGLRKSAIHFQIEGDKDQSWMNLMQLLRF